MSLKRLIQLKLRLLDWNFYEWVGFLWRTNVSKILFRIIFADQNAFKFYLEYICYAVPNMDITPLCRPAHLICWKSCKSNILFDILSPGDWNKFLIKTSYGGGGRGRGQYVKSTNVQGCTRILLLFFFAFFFFFLRYYANNYCHKVALSRYIETFILSLSQRHGPLEESVWTSTLTFIIKFQPLSQATGSVWERSLYIARGGVGGVSDDFGSVTIKYLILPP